MLIVLCVAAGDRPPQVKAAEKKKEEPDAKQLGFPYSTQPRQRMLLSALPLVAVLYLIVHRFIASAARRGVGNKGRFLIAALDG